MSEKPTPSSAWAKELTRLRTRVAELEAEVTFEQKQSDNAWDSYKSLQRYAESRETLIKELQAENAARRAREDALHLAAGALHERIAELEAERSAQARLAERARQVAANDQ